MRNAPALLLGLFAALAAAQDAAPVCGVDRPVAAPGARVVLSSWPASEAPWQVSAGSLSRDGGDTVWLLPGRSGRVSATLASCRVEVFVVDESRGGARETGTAFLKRGDGEAAGFGLYSYFLLGAPPDGATRERVLKAIDAYLAMTPSLDALAEVLEPAEINVNLMPVDALPGAKPDAQWVLDHYDYARARQILRGLDARLRQGPYLVSVLKPANGAGVLSAPLLLQDLSAVPPHLSGDWYRAFLNQAAQERFWEEDRLERLGRSMRLIVAVTALGLPDVQGAVQQWVKWSK